MTREERMDVEIETQEYWTEKLIMEMAEHYGVIYIEYREDENTFYDPSGMPLYNIYTLLTPNEVALFRSDPSYCLFPYKYDNDITIEIYTQ